MLINEAGREERREIQKREILQRHGSSDAPKRVKVKEGSEQEPDNEKKRYTYIIKTKPLSGTFENEMREDKRLVGIETACTAAEL